MNQETQWLKSPINQNHNCLQLHSHIQVAPYAGQKRKMQLRYTNYSIGCDSICDLMLDDPFVSKQHAKLYLDGSGYIIEDLGSKNGVFLNGVKVQKANLQKEGHIRIGRSFLSWRESDSLFTASDLPPHWIVVDPLMKRCLAELKLIARSQMPVLIRGETGSGKEMFASLLHEWSPRSNQAFIPLNGANAGGSLIESELFGHAKGAYTGADCNRLGSLSAANHGTLYLDEVGDLPLGTQVKLLRAFESGEVKALGSDRIQSVDVRLVSATSQNLEDLVEGGSFRLDFYYRIAGHVITVPALRDRPLDIAAIAKHKVEQRNFFLHPEAESKLLSHSWPGNVRELVNVMERAMLLLKANQGQCIMPDHIVFSTSPKKMSGSQSEKIMSLADAEADMILRALERTGWSKSITAKELGIARSTLFAKMKRHKIRDHGLIQ